MTGQSKGNVSTVTSEQRQRVLFIFDRVMHYHVDTLRSLEAELAARGVDLFLLSSKDGAGATGRVAFDGTVVARHRFFQLLEWQIGTFVLRYQKGLVPLLREIGPTTVVSLCHSGTISEWKVASLKRRLHFRLIAWQCGYEYNPGALKTFVLKRFVPLFDHHLAYHSNARRFALAYGAKPSQVTVMHNTINEAAFTCMPKVAARRKIESLYPQATGRRIVLYVGAVLIEKRLELIFDALDILDQPDILFLLVGDGPHLPAIRSKFSNRSDFVATGRIVDEVGAYFDAADVFVLPGTGGLAINEAMAHALPVISSFADGSADDLVLDGRNGYRLRQSSAEELANRLRDVLADSQLAQEMGQSGRRMIQGELSFQNFIRRVVGVLLPESSA